MRMPEKDGSMIGFGFSAATIMWPLIVTIIFIGVISLLIPSSRTNGIFIIVLGFILALFFLLYQIGSGQVLTTREPGLREDI